MSGIEISSELKLYFNEQLNELKDSLKKEISDNREKNRADINQERNFMVAVFSVMLAILGFIGWNQIIREVRETVNKKIDEIGETNIREKLNGINTALEDAERLRGDIENIKNQYHNELSQLTNTQNRISSLEGKIIGDQRLLTLSHFVDLEEKIIIRPGEEKTLGETRANFAVFPIGSFRVGLWVSVEGSTQNTQNTTIEFYHHCPGCGQNNSWKLNENIGSWTISGLDWNDHYISLNISKISPPPARFNHITNFKIKNTGNKTLEIFSYGIIQEVNSYVQN